MANKTVAFPRPAVHTKLNRQQITGFWGAWTGWTLDGMDSVIYALVLSPALTELLPKSGIKAYACERWICRIGPVCAVPHRMGTVADLGPDRRPVWPHARAGRHHLCLRGLHRCAALSQNVWQLALFRLLAGIGIGGEWALAGTYVAEAWPEDRRKMGAGYLQTGYYAGFFLASALNYTVGAHFGWRAMFWCGLTPVVVAFIVLLRVKEPERWEKKADVQGHRADALRWRKIFSPPYTRRTVVNTVLLAAAICGLWAGAVYAPTAIIALAKKAGMLQPQAVRTASFGMGLLSLGTILGCLAVPPLAERIGRKRTLAFYFSGWPSASCSASAGRFTCRGTEAVYHGAVLSGFLRRQLRGLQPMAAGAVRYVGARDRVRLHHFLRALHRRRRKLRHRRAGEPHGNAGQAGGDHGDRVWDRAAGDSLRRGNAGQVLPD